MISRNKSGKGFGRLSRQPRAAIFTFTAKLKQQRNRANEHRKSDRNRNRLPYRNHLYFSATGKDFVIAKLTGE